MRIEKNQNQKKQLKSLFYERCKENVKTKTEIYRMIYFLNKIEGPHIEDLYKKFKIQFTETDKADLKRNIRQNLATNNQNLN